MDVELAERIKKNQAESSERYRLWEMRRMKNSNKAVEKQYRGRLTMGGDSTTHFSVNRHKDYVERKAKHGDIVY